MTCFVKGCLVLKWWSVEAKLYFWTFCRIRGRERMQGIRDVSGLSRLVGKESSRLSFIV